MESAKGRRLLTVLGGTVAAGAVLAAAAGCSSSSGSSTPSATSTVTVTSSASASSPASSPASGSASASASGPGAAAACATSELKITLGPANGYAGGTYTPVVFTNTSSSPCTLYGYPGVSLVSASHTQIGPAAKRSPSAAVKLITVAPGGIAHAQLQIVDALNFTSSTCEPTKATYVKVYPPNQTAPVYLATAAQGCSKSVQVLYINAVQTGTGS